jgi:hypothetical protein
MIITAVSGSGYSNFGTASQISTEFRNDASTGNSTAPLNESLKEYSCFPSHCA